METVAGNVGVFPGRRRRAALVGRGMAKVTTTTIREGNDPLGCEGDVLARVRAMAKDAVAGVNEDAVAEEAAILRARLRAAKGSDDAQERLNGRPAQVT
jgi:hypothetical protein